MAKKKAAHGGGHGWFVTFADLMGLLMSFFVMLVAFSNQDSAKLQVVAGSMRDAFGVQNNVRYSGIVEVGGLPTRPKLKNSAHIPPEEATANPSPEPHDKDRTTGERLAADRAFALAAASLRQAMQDLPEISEVSKNIMIEETSDGVNVEIVDQDGRSMFPEGSQRALRTHPPHPRKAGDIAKGDAVAHHHHGPYVGIPRPLASRPGSMGTFGRTCRGGAPNPRSGRRAAVEILYGRWPRRHAAAVPGRPVSGGQPEGDNHPDAGRAADPDGF